MAKATHGLDVIRNTSDMSVTFRLVEKATEKVVDTLTLHWADVHDDAKGWTSLYGLTKVLMDRDSQTPMLEKLDAFSANFEATLKIGVLQKPRTHTAPTVRIEVEALAAIKNCTVGQAQALLRKYDEETRKKILEGSKVQAKVKQLKAKAEKAEEASGDLDDLIDEE